MKRGRPKGYSPYTEITYEELADWVGRKAKIPVSKKWLQALMGEDTNEESSDFFVDESSMKDYDAPQLESKIEYTLTHFENE